MKLCNWWELLLEIISGNMYADCTGKCRGVWMYEGRSSDIGGWVEEIDMQVDAGGVSWVNQTYHSKNIVICVLLLFNGIDSTIVLLLESVFFCLAFLFMGS